MVDKCIQSVSDGVEVASLRRVSRSIEIVSATEECCLSGHAVRGGAVVVYRKETIIASSHHYNSQASPSCGWSMFSRFFRVTYGHQRYHRVLTTIWWLTIHWIQHILLSKARNKSNLEILERHWYILYHFFITTEDEYYLFYCFYPLKHACFIVFLTSFALWNIFRDWLIRLLQRMLH